MAMTSFSAVKNQQTKLIRIERWRLDVLQEERFEDLIWALPKVGNRFWLNFLCVINVVQRNPSDYNHQEQWRSDKTTMQCHILYTSGKEKKYLLSYIPDGGQINNLVCVVVPFANEAEPAASN
jgi:hypothetical protein